MTKPETKQEVFDEFANRVMKHGNDSRVTLTGPRIVNYMKRYADAQPDDLPVIPKAVGEYIRNNKDLDLLVALTIASNGYKHSELWIAMHQDTFARAWVLEAWSVEETGEIVKLEVEK